MQKFIKTLVVTVALLCATVARADSSFSGTISRIQKFTSANSLYNAWHGHIYAGTGIAYWSGSDGYCAGFPEPSTTDLTLLAQAQQAGVSVTIYYQNQNSLRCYTGFQID